MEKESHLHIYSKATILIQCFDPSQIFVWSKCFEELIPHPYTVYTHTQAVSLYGGNQSWLGIIKNTIIAQKVSYVHHFNTAHMVHLLLSRTICISQAKQLNL